MEKKKTPMDKKKTSVEKKKRYRGTCIQYRCNMIGFSDLMKIYKPMLEDRKDVCEHLEKTPFWSLIKLYMDDILVVTKRKKKFDTDLIKIIIATTPKTRSSDLEITTQERYMMLLL
ncbi:hypothetical protein D8674_037528 [Pyrus ussuriensis x Pyrus communis]|uniref:Uncharacterized protein n=1 Tax=Pyrus ussuriensis x Pyrus communis TaxID=2448454 RepID=A0A5N5GUR6_9ROSA|nr:hypothetical protein D8674_037528 [Pyrus ussuriensis x Pyrus communis]